MITKDPELETMRQELSTIKDEIVNSINAILSASLVEVVVERGQGFPRGVNMNMLLLAERKLKEELRKLDWKLPSIKTRMEVLNKSSGRYVRKEFVPHQPYSWP